MYRIVKYQGVFTNGTVLTQYKIEYKVKWLFGLYSTWEPLGDGNSMTGGTGYVFRFDTFEEAEKFAKAYYSLPKEVSVCE